MNLLHLQYFYVVSREGSFSRASRQLKINQSALSRMVKQIENRLNMNLLERRPRGVRLTAQGESVFKEASEIFSKVDALKLKTGQLSQVCQGELGIGTTDSIAQALLPEPLKIMARRWENTHPVVKI